VFKQLDRLETIKIQGQTETNEAELHEITDRISEGMISARNKACQNRRLPWSPALKEAQIDVECWLKVISSIRNNIRCRTQLERLIQKLPQSPRSPTPATQGHVRSHQPPLNVLPRAKAAAAALSSDEDKETILKRLMSSQTRNGLNPCFSVIRVHFVPDCILRHAHHLVAEV
jgi:hypothetical protein